LVSPKEGAKYTPFDPQNGADLIVLNVDYGKFSTQYSQPFSVLSLSQDGFASGRLDGISIDTSGVVRANYTNGQQQALGKIILANFASPNGLKQIGNANYVATSNSGPPSVGEAGSDGFGSIQGGALERANVDLTEELVQLITAQRNFQANAKAIETATNLTSTIVNIRG
jgi:flagellar hook protein FlgE